jgi:hypothetical protein|tara:strand:+ start:343 stop:519 length:177 start_codon:yes stop_codon:yes gene_type:complete
MQKEERSRIGCTSKYSNVGARMHPSGKSNVLPVKKENCTVLLSKEDIEGEQEKVKQVH